MFAVCQILVSALPRQLVLAAGVVVVLAACGQKGVLFLPTDPASVGRATLPETIRPAAVTTPAAPASAPPATGTASPIPNAQ